MCDPVTIALGAGGIGGGSLLQGLARRRASNAIDDLIDEEDARQDQFTTQALQNIQTATGSFDRDTFDAEMARQEEELGQQLKDVQINLEEVSPDRGVVPSAPRIVADFEASEREEARDFTDALAESRARLRSFEEAMVPAGIAVGRSAQRNLPIASFMRGSNQAFREEVEDARRKAQSPVGDILVGLGGIGLNYGLGGGSIGNIFSRTTPGPIQNIGVGYIPSIG